MCGITGTMNLDGRPVERDILTRMTDTLAHRGPDGEGFHLDGPVGLGHRRLNIIDLSEHGNQPMCNEDGTVWITYNGEIYNYLELRPSLEASGHRFSSNTDTEVILHLYEERGVECLHQLNGMFAFGLWDGRSRRLWIARDRLGIKPMFYAQAGESFVFGSEIKALLAHPAIQPEINYEALNLYLSLNYVPAPYTLFKGIHQLLPGQYLTISADQPESVTETYWDIPVAPDFAGSLQDAEEELAAHLARAVSMRLVSDVPLGAFLSGGLDSSTIAYWMTQASSDPVCTFSTGFAQEQFNELPYARMVSEHLHTSHTERVVTPDFVNDIRRIVWHAEEPTADSSMIPVFYLSQMTREHVTVALSGDGGDEVLAGYSTYSATHLARLAQILPRSLFARMLLPLAERIPPTDGKVGRDEQLRRLLAGLGLPWQEAHSTWRLIFSEAQKDALVNPAIRQEWDKTAIQRLYQSYFEKRADQRVLDQMLYVDTLFYLPNDMLVKVDRMSMAHGLEARVPLLDHELVSFVATLPPNFKRRYGVGKRILKETMRHRLPREVVARRKQGFNVPKNVWFRGELHDFIHEMLSDQRVRGMGFLNVAGVQQLLAEHESRRRDHSHQLWCLLVLSIWCEQFT